MMKGLGWYTRFKEIKGPESDAPLFDRLRGLDIILGYVLVKTRSKGFASCRPQM